MSIESLAAIGNLVPHTQIAAAGPVPEQQPSALFTNLVDQVGELNQRMHANDASLQSLALGNGEQLHRVMMDLESTRLSFDLMLQVRNKVLDAYQELMRLQV
jgi:flagellar hook-basal body complex protein FliE